MFETELQWTPTVHRPSRHEGTDAPSERAYLLEQLEDRIASLMGGHRPLILPSGRAALGFVLQTLELSRGDAIAAPRWSSACVWGTLGRFACPTLQFAPPVDAALVVHKYGYVEACRDLQVPVIEDSCDSLVTRASALFPNAGVAELISLPKILGTYAGGLLFFRDTEIAERLRPLTRHLGSFQAAQGLLRWQETQTDTASSVPTWDHQEYRNFAPDLSALHSLAKGLAEWEIRSETISRRLDRVESHRPDLWAASPFRPSPGRLPCVLPLPVSALDEIPPPLSVRRMNTSGSVDQETFHPMALLPLHIGFPDSSFEEILGALKLKA